MTYNFTSKETELLYNIIMNNEYELIKNGMTVAELIKELRKMPKDMHVAYLDHDAYGEVIGLRGVTKLSVEDMPSKANCEYWSELCSNGNPEKTADSHYITFF